MIHVSWEGYIEIWHEMGGNHYGTDKKYTEYIDKSENVGEFRKVIKSRYKTLTEEHPHNHRFSSNMKKL